ncbi:MAG: FecR domain-containing protein, partial [Desulfobacterales bacterium]|nr:FecR domain-containing protein [Desulfobacterales bacterium]
MKSRISIALMVFTLLLFEASPTLANSTKATVGRVVAIRGVATATLAEASRLLSARSVLYEKDIIKTAANSRIQLQFHDKTLITLGPKTDLSIEVYQWDAQQKKGEFTHKIKDGVFRVLGGAITKSDPKKFRTETPVATIGIRGSIYMGSFKDGQLKVLFQGGTGIDVYNEAGSVPVTIPGFGTRVTSQESPPEEPEPFTGEDIQDLELQPITASDKQEESDETDSEEEGSDETDSEEEDSDEEDSEEEDSGEEDS